MSTTTNKTWLDVMPAIPLMCLGVPVTDGEDLGWVSSFDPRWFRIWRHGIDGESDRIEQGGGWVVDLDDPQGQRYAVGYLLDAHGATTAEWGIPGASFNSMVRLLRGKGTEADKLWLARALAEVLP